MSQNFSIELREVVHCDQIKILSYQVKIYKNLKKKFLYYFHYNSKLKKKLKTKNFAGFILTQIKWYSSNSYGISLEDFEWITIFLCMNCKKCSLES